MQEIMNKNNHPQQRQVTRVLRATSDEANIKQTNSYHLNNLYKYTAKIRSPQYTTKVNAKTNKKY